MISSLSGGLWGNPLSGHGLFGSMYRHNRDSDCLVDLLKTRKFSYISYKRGFAGVTAVCYFWRDGERHVNYFNMPYYYFYAKPGAAMVLQLDRNNYNVEHGYKNVYGEDVVKVIPKKNMVPAQYKEIQEKYKGHVFECDVKAIDRWLWETKPTFTKDIRIWYIDIEVLRDKDGRYSSVEDASNQIASICFYDNFQKKYHVFVLGDKQEKTEMGGAELMIFDTERIMLKTFLTTVGKFDPDYFTGWNVINFDMAYLINRMKNLGIDYKELSPEGYVVIKSSKYKGMDETFIKIFGRGMIDLMTVSKLFWLGTDVGYSLDAISKKFLNRGKIVVGNIDTAFTEDMEKFISYNIRDVELCVDLDKQLKLIATMQTFQDFITINLDETPVAGKTINYYLKQHSNVVLDDSYEKTKDKQVPGGYVHPTAKGIFKNIRKYDFVSHYPSIIRTYNISTDTIVSNPSEEEKKNLIHFSCYYRWYNEANIKGARIVLNPTELEKKELEFFEVWFRKDVRGVIPRITDKLFDTRLDAKKAGDRSKSTVLKRMLNSIYGQFIFKYSRFFSWECGTAITLIGQFMTSGIIQKIEKNGIGTVVMGDTDSFAVDFNKDHGEDEVMEIVSEYFRTIRNAHNIDRVYASIELEATIDKMVLFGVKKKYAQLIDGKMKIQGLEMIRKDYPQALKDFQKEILNRVFAKDDVGLADVQEARRLVEVRIREALLIKNYKYCAVPTVIRKPIEEYATNTAEKKALKETDLKMSMGEQFYILYCAGDRPLAFKETNELEKFKFAPDYTVITDKIFRNIKLFEELFVKQTKIGDWFE
jgi:DNA polymerase I